MSEQISTAYFIEKEFSSIDNNNFNNKQSKLTKSETEFFLSIAIDAYSKSKYPISETEINEELDEKLKAKLIETHGNNYNPNLTASSIIKSAVIKVNNWKNTKEQKSITIQNKATEIENKIIITRNLSNIISNKVEKYKATPPAKISDDLWSLYLNFADCYENYVDHYRKQYNENENERHDTEMEIEIDRNNENSNTNYKIRNKSNSPRVLGNVTSNIINNPPRSKRSASNQTGNENNKRSKDLRDEITKRLAKDRAEREAKEEEKHTKLMEYFQLRKQVLLQEIELQKLRSEYTRKKLETMEKINSLYKST